MSLLRQITVDTNREISLKSSTVKMTDCEVKKEDKNGSWTYDEAFEITGHGCYNYQVLLTCSIISIATALDMFAFAITVAAAACDLNLTISQIGFLGASPFAGLLFAYPWGYYADTRGRKQALLLSTSVGFIFAFLGTFAANWQIMLALKVISCSFSTASYSLTITYLGESTREKNRGQYLFIMISMNLATEFVSFSLAYFILPLTLSYSIPFLSITFTSWRLYALVLSAWLGIGAVLMLFLKESPKFLADTGREDKALETLRAMFIRNGGKGNEFPIKALHSPVQEKQTACASLLSQMAQIFTPPLLWKTLQLFYLICLSCSINNAFVMWFPTMLDIVFKTLSSNSTAGVSFCESIGSEVVASHEDKNIPCTGTISEETIYSGILASVILTSINLCVAQFAAWRRLVLMTALAIAGFSCVMIVFLEQPIASIVFFSLAQITAIGLGSIASYFVDVYPTSCRGLAPSLGFMLGRFISLSSVIIIGATITNYCSTIFYVTAALAFSGTFVVLFLP